MMEFEKITFIILTIFFIIGMFVCHFVGYQNGVLACIVALVVINVGMLICIKLERVEEQRGKR